MRKSKSSSKWVRPNGFYYGIAKIASGVVARCLFKRKFLRNELKGKRGPYVVIANHQAALDFVNLIGATKEKMTFVISHSFYHTLPFRGIMDKIGVIPKQQFQTSMQDIRRMKAVIDAGGILVIYPAGLMCEDGRSTPIPAATYRFLQWLKTDVYVARTSGAYFVTPKWRKKVRLGKTLLDIYQLFTKEALAEMPLSEVKAKTDEAILFDAYREQEELRILYRGGDNIEGLENVIYQCPHCQTEFSLRVEQGSILRCDACGYREESDKYGFLHKLGSVGEEVRYVSDLSSMIYERLKQRILTEEDFMLTATARFQMIDGQKNTYVDVGQGTVTLTAKELVLCGQLRGEPFTLSVSSSAFPSLPFRPGVRFEVQDGEDTYRCVLDDGKQVMKFVNAVKICYELAQADVKRREDTVDASLRSQ